MVAELGMPLRLGQSQRLLQSRSSVSPNSQQDPVSSWSLRSAVEREVEIARKGEDPLEAGERAPRKYEKYCSYTSSAQVSRAQPKFKIDFSILPADASLSAVVNDFVCIYRRNEVFCKYI